MKLKSTPTTVPPRKAYWRWPPWIRSEKKSSFSNYGRWVGVSAPGSDICSPFPAGQYATWSGTSMATPFVAGQAALLLYRGVPMRGVERDERGEHRVECVSGLIQETAESLDATNPDYAGMLGEGHADAGVSVDYVRSDTCPPETDGDDGDDCSTARVGRLAW